MKAIFDQKRISYGNLFIEIEWIYFFSFNINCFFLFYYAKCLLCYALLLHFSSIFSFHSRIRPFYKWCYIELSVCVCVWGAQTIALELLRPTLNASFIIKDFNANLLPFQAFLITSFLFAASFSNLTAKLFYDNILWCCRQSLILGLRAHSTCYALAFHLRQFYSVVEPLTLHSSSCIWIACGGGGTGACWHEEQQKRHNYMI